MVGEAFAMKTLKSMLALLLTMALLSAGTAALAEGFSSNSAAMNVAAQSVLKLEAYKSGTLFATGSGFIAYDSGCLVTNYHVIDGADRMIAYTDSGDPYEITQVLAADMSVDMAILTIESSFTPLPVAVSDPERGSRCIAIGSPQGYKNSFSDGMISGMIEEDGVQYVQFTAPISSGSSGGALFNDAGEVVGITTQTRVGSGGNVAQNLNFAVDIRQVTQMYQEHRNDAPILLSDVRKIADESYRNDYVPGDQIPFGNMAVQVPSTFTVETTSDEIIMTRGDAVVSIIALDMADFGDIASAATSLIGLFVSINDLALSSIASSTFNQEYDTGEFSHPSLPCGQDCAMTPARYVEMDGMNKYAAMAMVNKDTCYLRVRAVSVSGSEQEIESVLLDALNTLVDVG